VQKLRHYLTMGGLAVGLSVLAACGASPTATPGAVATTAATTVATARPTTAPAASATTSTSSTAAATRTTGAATSTAARPVTPAAATATRASTPTAGTATSGTATRTGSPTAAVLPAQAVTALQQLDNSRQAWVFSGFTVAGLSGDLSPVFEYNGGNKKVTLATAGTNIEAYQVGGTLYVRAPIGGVIQADSSNPLAGPAQTLFSTPTALLSALVPANTSYTIAGTETVNGRQATRYTANVAISDLSIVNPALAGQGGTAATTVWVDTTQGVLVALQSNITATSSNTTATARLDVTNIGQVAPIAVPR
jgi:hypothetical protein